MKRLLMVDDVATNLRLVSEVLKGQYEVHAAKSGEQALKMILGVKPDLVLLDISMPRMDGYAVIEKLRGNPATADIPIIILTGDTTQGAEAKALKMGAMDFIRKPFEPMILKTRIEKALSIAEIRSGLELTSKKDPLTGLWNRVFVEEYFDKLPKDEQGSIMMLDLDNFKGLNDTYGHVVGDKSLISFGNTLMEMTDASDIVSRIGGDEFVVIRSGVHSREELRDFCHDLIARVEININEILGETMEKPVTVSIGIAQFPDDGSSFLELYNCADKALYYVKQNGKRGYHFYQDDCRTLAEISRENAMIDMKQLKYLISEENSAKGAYQVEYEGFTRIYRFVNRCVERTGQNVQVVLFTLSVKDEKEQAETLSEAMNLLEDGIYGLLRRADVATRYSANQYVVILMDANQDNGMIAVNRVMDNFRSSKFADSVELSYEIQDVFTTEDK